jgi:hypothetical protein
MKNLREEMIYQKKKINLIQEMDVTIEENKTFLEMKSNNEKLPDGVYEHLSNKKIQFYRIVESDLKEDELKEYYALKQLSYVRTIKNIMLFFLIIWLIGSLISIGLAATNMY